MTLPGARQDVEHDFTGTFATATVDHRIDGVQPFLGFGRVGVGDPEPDAVRRISLDSCTHRVGPLPMAVFPRTDPPQRWAVVGSGRPPETRHRSVSERGCRRDPTAARLDALGWFLRPVRSEEPAPRPPRLRERSRGLGTAKLRSVKLAYGSRPIGGGTFGRCIRGGLCDLHSAGEKQRFVGGRSATNRGLRLPVIGSAAMRIQR